MVVVVFRGRRPAAGVDAQKRNKHRQVAGGSFEVGHFFQKKKKGKPAASAENKSRTRNNRVRATRTRTARTRTTGTRTTRTTRIRSTRTRIRITRLETVMTITIKLLDWGCWPQPTRTWIVRTTRAGTPGPGGQLGFVCRK